MVHRTSARQQGHGAALIANNTKAKLHALSQSDDLDPLGIPEYVRPAGGIRYLLQIQIEQVFPSV